MAIINSSILASRIMKSIENTREILLFNPIAVDNYYPKSYYIEPVQ